jgi:hypothetical protein
MTAIPAQQNSARLTQAPGSSLPQPLRSVLRKRPPTIHCYIPSPTSMPAKSPHRKLIVGSHKHSIVVARCLHLRGRLEYETAHGLKSRPSSGSRNPRIRVMIRLCLSLVHRASGWIDPESLLEHHRQRERNRLVIMWNARGLLYTSRGPSEYVQALRTPSKERQRTKWPVPTCPLLYRL